MDNTPLPRQSDLTGRSSPSGMSQGRDPSETGSSGLGSTYTTGSGEQAHHAVERASATAHQTVDRLDEKTRKLTDAPMRAWETSRTQVQDHPMQAIAASLVIGFLLGRLTGSRGRYDDL